MEKRKRNKSAILIGILVTLACANLLVLLLWPDEVAERITSLRSQPVQTQSLPQGQDQSGLDIGDGDLQYDGTGVFDPLAGVTAQDVDGTDLSDQIAVNFVSGKRIDDKIIRYTVFNRAGKRLEAERQLSLEGYTGPSIDLKELGSATWEELQRFPAELIETGQLRGEDGFGNDVSAQIACYFEINPERQTAEVTFSLYNGFQDYCSCRAIIPVEELPEDYEGLMP